MTRRETFLIVLVAVQALLVVALAVRAMAPDRARPAQYPECIGRLEGRPVCDVAASDLFAASQAMDGRLIRVTGYLAVDRGVVSLYPDESDYLLRVNAHALVVRGSLERQRRLVEAYAYRPVRLIGRYAARDEGSMRTGRIGAIHLLAEEAIPARGPREGADSILVNLEDLAPAR